MSYSKTQFDLDGLPALLTLAEAAKALRISKRTAQRWIDAKILPAVQMNPRRGSRWLIAKMDIIQLVAGKGGSYADR